MAEKIVEYALLSNDIGERLGEDVNAKLKDGWSLYGNPMCWAALGEYSWPELRIYQAMVKYERT